MRMKKITNWKNCTNEKCTDQNYTNKKYMNGKSKRMKSIRIAENENQLPNVFLTKPNGKCTQPNKKVVLSDSWCSWSNIN